MPKFKKKKDDTIPIKFPEKRMDGRMGRGCNNANQKLYVFASFLSERTPFDVLENRIRNSVSVNLKTADLQVI